MIESFRDGAIVVLALFLLVAHAVVPHLVLRRQSRRRRKPVVDGLRERPPIARPPLDTAHRW